MELIDFKSNLILKMKFDALSSVPGTYNMINFWPSFPYKNFSEQENSVKLYVCRFEMTYTCK